MSGSQSDPLKVSIPQVCVHYFEHGVPRKSLDDNLSQKDTCDQYILLRTGVQRLCVLGIGNIYPTSHPSISSGPRFIIKDINSTMTFTWAWPYVSNYLNCEKCQWNQSQILKHTLVAQDKQTFLINRLRFSLIFYFGIDVIHFIWLSLPLLLCNCNHWHLLLGIVLSTFPLLIHLFFIQILWGRHYFLSPHFTDEETVAARLSS